MAKTQKKTQKKVAVEQPSVPQDVGVPTETAGERAHRAKQISKAGQINKHGGKVFQVDAERGIIPNSKDGHSALSSEDKEMVTVELNYDIRFNNRMFNRGTHKVPRHVAQQLQHMAFRKKKNDDNVKAENKYKWKKGLGRKQVVTEHKDL